MGSWALSVVLMRGRGPGRRRAGGPGAPGSGRCAVRGADAGEARRGRARGYSSPDRRLPPLLQATAGCVFDSGGGGSGDGGGRRGKRRPPDSGARPPERSPARGQRLGSRPGAEAPPLLPFPPVKRLELCARSGGLRDRQTPRRERQDSSGARPSACRGSGSSSAPFLSYTLSPPDLPTVVQAACSVYFSSSFPVPFLCPLPLPPFAPFQRLGTY